ncbi:hypothetical protein [Streptomyces sp. WM6368]|uniref:hypothetical protein n=1 Tax=Streptomyces sp. WM6368 TaxID=1415554 RepID=UPI0006ADFEE1|nr:hypothetical protein [Streptomyces sp. WM6368]KOU16158.1 hypothetical protein ADK51_32155 [Streptomyces sp. WM6368]
MAVPAVGLVVSAAAPAASATITRTFDAGADQPFTVPAGVTRLQVTAKGADGIQATQGNAGRTGPPGPGRRFPRLDRPGFSGGAGRGTTHK